MGGNTKRQKRYLIGRRKPSRILQNKNIGPSTWVKKQLQETCKTVAQRYTALSQPYLHNQYKGCNLRQAEPKINGLIYTQGKLLRRK